MPEAMTAPTSDADRIKNITSAALSAASGSRRSAAFPPSRFSCTELPNTPVPVTSSFSPTANKSELLAVLRAHPMNILASPLLRHGRAGTEAGRAGETTNALVAVMASSTRTVLSFMSRCAAVSDPPAVAVLGVVPSSRCERNVEIL